MRNPFKLVQFLAVLGIVAVVSYKLGQNGGLSSLRSGSAVSSGSLDFSLLYKVRSHLAQSFLEKDKLDDKKMTYGAISGLVSSLGDPYTVFLPPDENKSSEEELKGEFGGVGISLGYKEKTLAVLTPLANTPAEKAGIKAGDLILKIADKQKNIEKDTNGLSLSEAVNLIRGPVGSSVSLTMAREGQNKTFEVTLTREIISVPSMELTWKEKNGKQVAWISLYRFTEKVYDEWPSLVTQIKQKETEAGSKFGGIVLDLRNNPGGYLEASVLVASDFLKDGVVVTQQSSDGKKQEYKVDSKRRGLVNEKMVTLVNGGTASAGEILAGALRDYNRSKLVGEKTFGKGTVQIPETFSDGSGLHITIAKWLLPSGKNIHKEGVMPDSELKWADDVKDEKDVAKVLDFLVQQ